ncbi:unnamed protein product [Cyprideis torosa]|uniref:limulus clotting factor C n=1 Tax=Cyprideis torosa TaxID=163714 RepID=A0A7R8WLT8_9CRUS|nr:unnamed protein product [Cyprideis torosa]CAG0904707.1 unnamed protein product [Cyprideis torosa]
MRTKRETEDKHEPLILDAGDVPFFHPYMSTKRETEDKHEPLFLDAGDVPFFHPYMRTKRETEDEHEPLILDVGDVPSFHPYMRTKREIEDEHEPLILDVGDVPSFHPYMRTKRETEDEHEPLILDVGDVPSFHSYRRTKSEAMEEADKLPKPFFKQEDKLQLPSDISDLLQPGSLDYQNYAKGGECGRPLLDKPPTPADVNLNRIVGGTTTVPGEIPFMVSLQIYSRRRKGWRHICGGTLISERFVLTAAHCMDNGIAKRLTVVVNDHDLSSESPEGFEKRIKIAGYELHRNFSLVTFTDDIGLLYLEEPVTFGKLAQPACVAKAYHDNFHQLESRALVTGWGRIQEGGFASPIQKKLYLDLIGAGLCQTMYGNTFGLAIEKTHVCAGNLHGGESSCQGDSGGPLFTMSSDGRFVVQGVVSAGVGCGRPFAPGLYTRVSTFKPWIDETMETLVNEVSLGIQEKEPDDDELSDFEIENLIVPFPS